MASWSGKTRGGVAGYKAFVLILKYLNIKVAYFVLKFVAFYYLVFSDKRPIKFYFKEILGYSTFKTLVSVYRNYCLLGQILIDKMAILAGFKRKFTFTFEGEEYLHQMSSEKQGGLLIGAHMGNWEVAGQLLERIDTRVNILMLESEHQKIKNLLDDVMVNKDVNIIPIKEDGSHQILLIEALKNKEIVAIHGDRYLPGTNTVTVKFMGKEAKFPAGPLYLASRYQVPVSFVYTLKEEITHYHFYATKGKIFEYPAKLKTRKEDIKKMVEEYVAHLEEKVKQYPLQWFNYFQFWD